MQDIQTILLGVVIGIVKICIVTETPTTLDLLQRRQNGLVLRILRGLIIAERRKRVIK